MCWLPLCYDYYQRQQAARKPPGARCSAHTTKKVGCPTSRPNLGASTPRYYDWSSLSSLIMSASPPRAVLLIVGNGSGRRGSNPPSTGVLIAGNNSWGAGSSPPTNCVTDHGEQQ